MFDFNQRLNLRTHISHNPYPTHLNPPPPRPAHKNELKATKTTKRDYLISQGISANGIIDHGINNKRLSASSSARQQGNNRSNQPKSLYSSSINQQLSNTTQQQQQQRQPVVVRSKPFTASHRSPSSRGQRNFGSTSSLNDLLPAYSSQQGDYYDDNCLISDLNQQGSLSDTEITLRLEPHPEDMPDIGSDLNESFQKLRTDANQQNGHEVVQMSKEEKNEDMKKVIQDIESQLTPPDQYLCMADQYFGGEPVTFEYVDDQSYKNEPNCDQLQKIEPKMFKTPMAPPPPPPLIKAYKEEPKPQMRKINVKAQKPTHLIMHQQMDSGTGSKGQSKLVDEAYDDFGTVADVKQTGADHHPCPIDFILVAATSPSTKVSEESLTYLNQGQSYGIRMRRRPEEFQRAGLNINTPLRIQLRVIFHERRLQNIEDEQLKTWSESRPCERFLEVVTELSEHISNVTPIPGEINCSEFSWSFKKNDTAIAFVVLNCISTEFTQRRHGGERGAPFRIQADVFKEGDVLTALNCFQAASCQVRVFKPRGADRKQRTDRDKKAKKSENPHDQSLFANEYDRTRLQPCDPWEPRQQSKYALLDNEVAEARAMIEQIKPEFDFAQAPNVSSSSSRSSYPSPSYSPGLVSVVSQQQQQQQNPGQQQQTQQQQSVPPAPPMPGSSALALYPQSNTDPFNGQLSELSSVSFVQQWLRRKSFHNFQSKFANFSGQDMLFMKREDYIQIGSEQPHKASMAECIRLYNAVENAKQSEQSNNLVLYCHLPGEQVADCYYPVFLRERTVIALKHELAQKLRLDPGAIGPILNSRKTTRTPGAMINVMVTDDMVNSFKTESSYKVMVKHTNSDKVQLTIQQT